MGLVARNRAAVGVLALVLAWTGLPALAQDLRTGQADSGGEDLEREDGWRGLAPLEPDARPRTDAEAAGLRTEEAPGAAASSPAGSPGSRPRTPERRGPGGGGGLAGPAAPPSAGRQFSNQPAPVANRHTGRLPRRPATSPDAEARGPRPALRPSSRVVNVSREDQQALSSGRRGVAVPNQQRRPVDVPIVVDRTRAPVGRALPNANPLGRGAVIDPVTGEVVSFARSPAPEQDPFAPTGLRLGSFVFTPTADVTLGYDSNPRRLNNGVQGSLFTQSYGEIQARSDWSRHELTARLRGTYSAYASTPDVNRPELNAVVTGRIDLARTTRIDTEAHYNLTAQSPGSSNLPGQPGTGLRNLPLIHQYGGSAALVQDFGRLQVTLRGTIDRYTYEDATAADGTLIPQGDRNYNAYGARLRASYELTPGLRPFVEVGVDRHAFDTLVSSGGIQQGSTSTSYRIGSTVELTRLITGEIAVGYLMRNNIDPTLADIRVPTFDATLVWTPTALTTVRFAARSAIDETFTTNAAGIQRRDFSIELEHSFRRWLIGTVRLAYGQDVYVANPRLDQRLVASASLVYRASRNLQIRGEVRREALMSNQPGVSYQANVFLFGIRLQR